MNHRAPDARTAPHRPPGTPHPATILVVEDEETIRLAAQRALGRRGYEVIVASDGLEALRILGERGDTIDLVLTDVTMPGMSGRDLVARLETERPGLPIVLMSGYAADLAQLGGHEGGHPFVQKPFTLEALASTIAGALKGH